MNDQLERALKDVLDAFDDGPRHCTGTMSSGELVWKGSFIAYMERLRSMLDSSLPSVDYASGVLKHQ